MFCSCKCGMEITQTRLIKWKIKNGQKNFYIKGHQYKKGSQNNRWKGGQYFDSKGYKFIKHPDHPNARKNGYVAESHLVISKVLKRPVDTRFEVVHHLNGIKTDNRPENIEIKTRKQHTSIHSSGVNNVNFKNRPPRVCPNCNKPFMHKNNYTRDKCCSVKCRNEYYTGEKANNRKINQSIANEIKDLKGTLSSQKIATLYNISPTHTKRILRGEIW